MTNSEARKRAQALDLGGQPSTLTEDELQAIRSTVSEHWHGGITEALVPVVEEIVAARETAAVERALEEYAGLMAGSTLTVAEVNALTGDDITYWLTNPFMSPDMLGEKVCWWVTTAIRKNAGGTA